MVCTLAEAPALAVEKENDTVLVVAAHHDRLVVGLEWKERTKKDEGRSVPIINHVVMKIKQGQTDVHVLCEDTSQGYPT